MREREAAVPGATHSCVRLRPIAYGRRVGAGVVGVGGAFVP